MLKISAVRAISTFEPVVQTSRRFAWGHFNDVHKNLLQSVMTTWRARELECRLLNQEFCLNVAAFRRGRKIA